MIFTGNKICNSGNGRNWLYIDFEYIFKELAFFIFWRKVYEFFFVKKLRLIRRFKNASELADAIRRDVRRARRLS